MTREEAIEIYNTLMLFGKVDCTKEEVKECCRMAIKALRKEPRKGRWITKPHVYGVAFCSECGFELKTNDTNFCPNCGADMREGKE